MVVKNLKHKEQEAEVEAEDHLLQKEVDAEEHLLQEVDELLEVANLQHLLWEALCPITQVLAIEIQTDLLQILLLCHNRILHSIYQERQLMFLEVANLQHLPREVLCPITKAGDIGLQM
jgi:hypothetical protein